VVCELWWCVRVRVSIELDFHYDDCDRFFSRNQGNRSNLFVEIYSLDFLLSFVVNHSIFEIENCLRWCLINDFFLHFQANNDKSCLSLSTRSKWLPARIWIFFPYRFRTNLNLNWWYNFFPFSCGFFLITFFHWNLLLSRCRLCPTYPGRSLSLWDRQLIWIFCVSLFPSLTDINERVLHYGWLWDGICCGAESNQKWINVDVNRNNGETACASM
jgi:hypothetical protein